MTRDEWLESTDPDPMIRWIRGHVPDAILRRFACACCFRIWGLIDDRTVRQAVLVADRMARGRTTIERLASLRPFVNEAWHDMEEDMYLREFDENYCVGGRYIALMAHHYAIAAARKAACPIWEDAPRFSWLIRNEAHDFAAMAMGCDARAAFLERIPERTRGPVVELSETIGQIAWEFELRDQAVILRDLVTHASIEGIRFDEHLPWEPAVPRKIRQLDYPHLD